MGSGKMLEASDVALGSIHLAIQNVLSTLIGVLGLAFLARAISQEEMGILTAVTLVSMFIQFASNFGLPASLAKYVSELKGRGEDISTHVVSVLILKIPAALTLCLALFLFSENVSNALFGNASLYQLIRLTALDSFFLALAPVFSSILLGLGRLRRIAVCGVTSVAARWLAIALLVWNGYGFHGAVVGWIVGDLINLLLLMISSVELVSLKHDLIRKGADLLPNLLRFSWPLFTASIVTFLHTWYDRAIVLAFLPLGELGIYDMSYKAFTVLAAMATALGQSLFPFYGMAYGKRAQKAISSGIKRASRYTIIIVFPLTLGLLSTSRSVITLFAGQSYEPGWIVLAILSVFGLTYGLSPTFAGLLLIHEKTREVLLLSFIPVISSLALLPLLWTLGVNGLAIMRGTSLLFTLLLTAYFLSKVVNMEIDKQAFTKALVSSAVMAAVVSGVQQIYYSRFLLPAYVLIGATVYLTGIKALKVLNKADLELMKQILGEKTAKHIIRILG